MKNNLIIVAVGVILTLILTIGIVQYKKHKESNLYDSKIIFKNEYKSSRIGVIYPDKKYPLLFQCEQHQTTVILTKDTLEIVSNGEKLGFKPLKVTEDNSLICQTKNGKMAVFVRFIPKGLEPVLSNELLIIQIEDQIVILSPKKECELIPASGF